MIHNLLFSLVFSTGSIMSEMPHPSDTLLIQQSVPVTENSFIRQEYSKGQDLQEGSGRPVPRKPMPEAGKMEGYGDNVERIDGIYYRFDSTNHEACVIRKDNEHKNIFSGVKYAIPSEVSHGGEKYTVTEIAEYAFYECQETVYQLTLPSTLRSIGYYAFYGTKIKRLRIPDSVESIGFMCFSSSELESLWIGDGVCQLESELFTDCYFLSEVHLGASVAHVNEGNYPLFYSWVRGHFPTPELKNIDVSADNPHLKSIDGVVCSADGTRLVIYPPGREEFTIPSSVYEFDRYACACCRIKEAALPEELGAIPVGCFSSAWNLESVTMPNCVDIIEEKAFSGTSLRNITFPQNLQRIEGEAFSNCLFSAITIPDQVYFLGGHSFANNKCLKKAHIGKEVTGLGEVFDIPGGYVLAAFQNPFPACDSLEVIEVDEENPWLCTYKGMLYDKSMSILYAVPGARTSIASDDFSPTLTSVAEEAFGCHNNVTDVVFPESVTLINSYAFNSCGQLRSIAFLSHALGFNGAFTPFYNCYELKDLYFRSYYASEDFRDDNSRLFYSELYNLLNGVPYDCVIHVPEGLKEAYLEKMRGNDYVYTIVDDQPMERNKMDWDYSCGYQEKGGRGGMNTSLFSKVPFEAGILIPKEQLANYKGCSITSVQFSTMTKETNQEIYAFISKGVGGERVQTDYKLHRYVSGWNTIHFAEPYPITGAEDVFIGIGLPERSGIYYSGYPVQDGVLWLNLQGQANIESWQDYKAFFDEYGAPCIAFTIEGENIPANIRLQENIVLQALDDKNACIEGKMESTTVGLAKGYDLSYRIDEGTTQTIHVDDTLAAKQLYDFRIPVKSLAKGKHKVEISCCGVDGREDGNAPDSQINEEVLLWLTPEMYERKVVVEEGTGTWCGWCPKGIVGVRAMMDKYPDTFIPIAIHYGDEMSDEYGCYMTFNGYPNCTMDRKYGFDPDAETLERHFIQEQAECADAQIALQAQWMDEEQRQVLIRTTTCFKQDTDENFRIAYLVTENQVGPYPQNNSYCGGADGRMGGFENEMPMVEMLHDHVSRYISDKDGTAGTVSECPRGRINYEHDYYLDMPDNIQNVQNTELTVLLINQETGEIVNADRIGYEEILPHDTVDAIDSCTPTKPSDGTYYNLHGVRITRPAGQGVFIHERRKKAFVH